MSDECVSKEECDSRCAALRREMECMVNESRATTLYEFSEMLEARIAKLEQKLTDTISSNNNSQNLILQEIKKNTDGVKAQVLKDKDRQTLILAVIVVILIGVIIGRGWDALIAGFV